jgi:deferrochelatase/peroxidase EfeB
MRRDLIVKTCSLAGTSDLTVIAPIRDGLVPSLDAITYKTRVKRVLRTLHLGRAGAHEYDLMRVLSDAVERVGRIHSVRIAVLEPENKVLLAATFDGAFESYVRVIWQKVARLLDLIFCNTEAYVTGWDHGYDEWRAWLRSRQTETSFLYAVPSLTVQDTQYLRMQERFQRRTPMSELDVVRMTVPSAESIAQDAVRRGVDPTNMGLGTPLALEPAGAAAIRQGLRSMVGLYRLADAFLPGTDDGELLLGAAHELLPEFSRMIAQGPYQLAIARVMNRFEEPVRWFTRAASLPALRQWRPPPVKAPSGEFANVQGGIVTAHTKDTEHGCALLVAFDSATALSAFLKACTPTRETDRFDAPGAIATNIAFTMEGLRLAGLSAKEEEALPEEFTQGMDRRAGLLGDVRVNHPRRWRLPPRNWAEGVAARDVGEDDPIERVDLNAVHAVVQLRRIRTAGDDPGDPQPPRQALFAALEKLVGAHHGVEPLSLQWMQRFYDAEKATVEHFGFGDGESQPVLDQVDDGKVFRNQVHLGELLLGYANEADLAPPDDDLLCGKQGLLRNGSFLVVRKLRQDVGGLDKAVAQVVASEPAGSLAPLDKPGCLAKMMGRWPSGHPDAGKSLVPPAAGAKGINDFDYRDDPQAVACPFHAHVRRAHPRTTPRPAFDSPGARRPRLFRRGMPYGPRHQPTTSDAAAAEASLAAERGLMFMAYNASIGEQFEVVQRWLAGGNASDSYSGQSDPFFGVAESGRERYFRFEHDGRVVRMALDGSDDSTAPPQPLVRLEWGMYFFAPSLTALDELRRRAGGAATAPMPWSAEEGEVQIKRLRQIECLEGDAAALLAWKAVLEDPEAAADFTTASVWAAIRARPAGALRTPFGVLVARRDLVEEVLLDTGRRLTATGYLPRMKRSFGAIYLGLDAAQEDSEYERQSKVCNEAIYGLDSNKAYETARSATLAALQALVRQAQLGAQQDREPRWELTLDVRELLDAMLGQLCETWFGLSTEGGMFRRGGYRRDWKEGDKPYYPGHFLAPSRYFFQPHPNAQVELVGAAHGVALRASMDAFLAAFGGMLKAPVARAVLGQEPGKSDLPLASRTLIGGLMGFVPTIDGNLRRVLNEWLRVGTFWSLRAQHAGRPAADLNEARKRLTSPLVRAMRLRPAPELLWRTATVSQTIGATDHEPGVEVVPGDIVIAAQVSAGHQDLEEAAAKTDLSFVFGGDRTAAAHPTHACPGQHAAMAVMYGFLAALVDAAEPLRAGAAPLSFSLEGPTPVPADALTPAPAPTRAAPATPPIAPHWSSSAEGRAGFTDADLPTDTIFTIGDSWLTDFIGHRPSLVGGLAAHFIVIADRFAPGRRLAEMAEAEYLDEVERQLRSAKDVKAIVLGGGGNDVAFPPLDPTATPLYEMLLQSPAPGEEALIEDKVADFIDRELRDHYRIVLERLVPFKLPILIHAYDHSVPDGRGSAGTAFPPWLAPIFDLRVVAGADRREGVMKRLIDRLNAMVAAMAKGYPRVHPVNLCGELARDPRYAQDYKLLWGDELHPTLEGYKVLAKVLVTKLRSLGL